MSATEARAALPQLLDRVTAGDEVTITRHGRPVAVLVRPDTLHTRRADASLEAADELRQLLDAARRSPLPDIGLSAARAAALVEEVRAGRDGH
ncbi:type II toxin-antitoxin system Phd/YefM family antitoxin [Iamia sp.]|uniref:type II toxin-antitoxin system Phd/YefM family antitoxin n=1 Tax=Iamia sp. TaxID=2722710 RepID=UPI002CBC1DD4|nr:type II toxin-antitoxin system Phd/YefM family antitoxin [Iamia sp.]HXH58743.1 type II toxin-antitoxin system Phd/YefM family antitoxin [Iamia sp.]